MRAAAVQLTAKADKAANLEKADRLVRQAAADGAELVVLPEKWTALGTGDDLRAAAEPIGAGAATAWAANIARELGIDLVAGSISERIDGEDKLRNTSLHYGPDGELKAAYRKIHMFDVEVGGVEYRESDNEDPGDEAVLTATSDGVEIGLTVCYDLRFPELYRTLALAGAEVLTVPSNFTERTGRDHWEVLLRARAIENGAWVLAPGQSGGPPGQPAFGRSMVIDPWGTVVAQASDGVGIVRADVETDRVAAVRRQIPSLANRRSNTYQLG
jgi:predicted amidohydrolase